MAASCALEWTRLYQLGSRACRRPCRRRAGLRARAAVACSWLGFAGSGVLWIAALVVGAVAGAALLLAARWPSASASWIDGAARAPRRAHRARRRPAHRRAGAARARAGGRGRARTWSRTTCRSSSSRRWSRCPSRERVAKERQKPLFIELADTKLPQVDLLDAAPRPRRRSVTPEIAGDDLAADREEAQGLRRRGARGRGLARPGDHALRDRAGHRREGRAGGQPGQGPGALAVAGQHPRGRDHSRQELHGAGAAQRQAPDDPPGRDPRLAGLQRRRLAADHGPGQGHRRRRRWWPTWPRCRTAWWPAPPARASRWASTR